MGGKQSVHASGSSGDEVCAQGWPGLPRVEEAELPRPEALAVPRAEQAAHDGPRQAVDTESGLAGERGRKLQGGRGGQRGQQLNQPGGREREWEMDCIYSWKKKK